MNTLDEQIQILEEERAVIDSKIAWLRKHFEKIPVGLEARFAYGTFFDFDRLTHDQVVSVIKSFGGRWEKSLAEDTAVDYTQDIDGVTVRCWHGDPPPNCKIVEELVTVPAQPETTKIVRKLVCKEVVDASQSL
jgi:hypothetical protein